MLSLVPVAAIALVQPHLGFLAAQSLPSAAHVPNIAMSSTAIVERFAALREEGATVVQRRDEVQAALATKLGGQVVPTPQAPAPTPKSSTWTPNKLRAEGSRVVELRTKTARQCAEKLASVREASSSAWNADKLREEGARSVEARAAILQECEHKMGAIFQAREQSRALRLSALKAAGAEAVTRRQAVQAALAEKLPEKGAYSAPPPAGFEWGATF